MSAYSTLDISRSAAQSYLVQEILRASDEKLEKMLDDALEERLYNARIGEGKDDYIL